MAAQDVMMKDLIYPCYVQRKDHSNQWYWVFYAKNRKAIAKSSEGYINESDCTDSIKLVQNSSSSKIYTPSDEGK